jgi:uncharacterized protein YqeY
MKNASKNEDGNVKKTLKLLPAWVKERESRAKKKIKEEKKYFVKVIKQLGK